MQTTRRWGSMGNLRDRSGAAGEFRLRCNEGGQELQSTGMEKLQSFLSSAKTRGDQVRARSLAQGYDRLPVELVAEKRQNPMRKP